MRKRFDVPDLSDLRGLSPMFAFRRFFQGAGPTQHKAYSLTMNYIRLVDTAIREYENGRRSLSDYEEARDAGLDLMLKVSSHFEVCIDALKRSLNHLEKIKAAKHVPQPMKDLLPRGLEVATGASVNQITSMRNGIQHLERDILKGKIVKGQSLCLVPEEDGLTLGDQSIHFRDLAKWLRELHGCADALAHYREPS